MKKPQIIALILILVGIISVIISFEIEITVNRHDSYNPADYTYHNELLKNVVYYGGLIISVIGALIFILNLRNKA